VNEHFARDLTLLPVLATWVAVLLTAAPSGATDFPLRVAANGRYLEDSSGKPFYFVGDTQWRLFLNYSFEEAREIIDDRAAKGFTAILVLVSDDNLPNRQGHAPFQDRATLEVDEAYFAHVDRVLDYAGAKGLAVYAGPLWWKFHLDASEQGIAAYGRWIGSRWKHRGNLIWVLGGDQRFRKADLPYFRTLAHAIREGGAMQIMSWHPYSGVPWLNSGRSSSGYLHDEPWLAFSSVQAHAQGGRMAERVLQDYNRTPAKPTILMESWYYWTELWQKYPIHQGTLRVRQSHYQARIGGGSFGEVYGAWPFWYLSSTPGEWRRALHDQPAATQIATYMRRCLEGLEWWKLEPDQQGEILVGGRGWRWSWARAVAAGDAGHSFAVAYVPTHREIEIDLGWFAAPVQARWFDPTDGAYSDAAVHANASVQRFRPPRRNRAGDEDFVLVMQALEQSGPAAPDSE
jgi:hypothetical protein